jgi:hypothetical protein
MPRELFEKVSAIASLDFEENKEKFSALNPRDIFIFSYIHGYRDAFEAYAPDGHDDMSEITIGDITTEVPSDVIRNSVSGAEKEFAKYRNKIKSMGLKEVYTLGFQSGFQRGFEIYSGNSIEKKDIKEPIKYYHANFDRLH